VQVSAPELFGLHLTTPDQQVGRAAESQDVMRPFGWRLADGNDSALGVRKDTRPALSLVRVAFLVPARHLWVGTEGASPLRDAVRTAS